MTTFATVINCMDGRTQQPVNEWVRHHSRSDVVDTITEAGPDGILATTDHSLHESIRRRVRISIEQHGSQFIAIVGHYDCAGYPVSEAQHHWAIQQAVQRLKAWYPKVKVVGLWVGNDWVVKQIV